MYLEMMGGSSIYGAIGYNTLVGFGGGGVIVNGYFLTLLGNIVVDSGDYGIKLTGAQVSSGLNQVYNPAGSGIVSSAGNSQFFGDFVMDAGDHGVDLGNPNYGHTLVGVVTKNSNRNGSGSHEFHVDGTDNLLIGCRVQKSLGGVDAVHEGSNAGNNHYVGVKHPGGSGDWTLGSGVSADSCRPIPQFDAAPSSPVIGQPYLASTSWDPDGDGNGEMVMYDGTNWNEIADMPAL